MLSYQHGYHAGNRADVFKHAVLHALLTEATGAGKPLLYIETHAGRGRYDLTSPEAEKTGEARTGVLSFLASGPLVPAPAPPPALMLWLDHISAGLPSAYPGSPALAAGLLREGDRLVLFELHPAERAALIAALGGDPRALIRPRDGYAGALHLAPRRGEAMLVLVDPSYELPRDIEGLAAWLPRALNRWPGAPLAVWLPRFVDAREADLIAHLEGLGASVRSCTWPALPGGKASALRGSAMALFHASTSSLALAQDLATGLTSCWASG